MQIFEAVSFPLEQVDPEGWVVRAGDFLASRGFPMRLIGHSTRFAMRDPIRAVRAQMHAAEQAEARLRPLRDALDRWRAEPTSAPPAALVRRLAERERADLRRLVGAGRAAQVVAAPERADADGWRALGQALDLAFWRLPWAKETCRMYQVMEQQHLRAAQYLLLTWEPETISAQAISRSLQLVTRRPVRRIESLPSVLPGPYRERMHHLEPLEAGQPYLTTLLSYDMQGFWDAGLFHDLISLNIDLSIAVDIATLSRNAAQRTAELAFNAARVVARDGQVVDTRGERVVADAHAVLHELRTQTLHAIQVAILVRGHDLADLEANAVTVRDIFGPRLKLMRPMGAQGQVIKLFSTLPRKRIEGPWKPRTQLSYAAGCAMGMLGFHRPQQTQGIFVGIERNARFPVFINLFARNQAAHMIIAGMSGSGKTVLLNLLAERAATVTNMQVIGIDAFANGMRVRDALAGCVCYSIGLEQTINIFDLVYGEESEGGWLNNQIVHVIGQLALILGEPGETADGKKRYIPIPMESSARGVLARAIKRVYTEAGVTPDSPITAMPTLTHLIGVLERMDDPIAAGFALRLRYFIYGSSTDTTEKTPEGLLFDGHTTIDWRFTAPVVYYDFRNVPEILLPILYAQTLGAAWRYARTRPITQNIFLMIDEFGYAAQAEAIVTMAWIIAKTARKYRVGMVLVDQTMRPFFETPTGRQLHANAAAHFFFHMKEIEAQEVAHAMGTISPANAHWLTEAEPGQCLAVFRKDVYQINVEAHPLEAAAFFSS